MLDGGHCPREHGTRNLGSFVANSEPDAHGKSFIPRCRTSIWNPLIRSSLLLRSSIEDEKRKKRRGWTDSSQIYDCDPSDTSKLKCPLFEFTATSHFWLIILLFLFQVQCLFANGLVIRLFISLHCTNKFYVVVKKKTSGDQILCWHDHRFCN